MQGKKLIVCLSLIFLLALILRVYKLGFVPHGFHSDEVVAGYEGTFILRNGTDTYGRILPLYFDKFGDFRPTGVFYLSGFTNLIFGQNVFAVRLAVSLAGALSVFAVYFLYLEIFGEKRKIGALASAFLLAASPWHVVLSRSTQESIVGAITISAGLVFLYKYLRQKRRKDLILAVVLLALTYFFYTAHRLLVPIILLTFLFETIRTKRFKLEKVLILVVSGSIVLSALILATPWGRSRGTQVLVFNNPVPLIVGGNLAFGDGPNNVLIARIFHNKVVLYSREVAAQYLSYFSPEFLFVKGGLPDRYLVIEQGLLYFSFIPLLVVGANAILRKYSWLPFYLLIVTPLVAFLTSDDVPNTNRVSFMVVPFVLIAGAGLEKIFELRKSILKYLTLTAFFVAIALEFSYFAHQYLVHESQHRSLYRNDQFIETAQYLSEVRGNYDKVLVNNTRDHMLIYFWFVTNNFDSSFRYEMNKFPDLFEFENMIFVKDECPSRRIEELASGVDRLLIIDNGDCPSSGNFHQLTDWKRGDSTQAFKALVVKENQ